MRVPSALCALVIAGAALIADAGPQWFLFGRHGECADLAHLKRRLPDLPPIAVPGDLVRYLQGKGLPYTEQAHPVPTGKAVEIHVPARGLAIVLVTADICPAGASAGN